MARPNYSFNKRQKELKRKKKQEEKRQRKLDKSDVGTADNPGLAPQDEKPQQP